MRGKCSFKVYCQEYDDAAHLSLRICISSIIKVLLEFFPTKWTKLLVLKIILNSELGVTLSPNDYYPKISLH